MKLFHRTLNSIWLVAEILLLWHFLAVLVDSSAFPVPIEVLLEFSARWKELMLHAAVSAGRVFSAVCSSTILALPFGLFIGSNNFVYGLISPLLHLFYPIPKIAFLPVIMLLFGLGNSAKILLMDLIIFFQILVTVVDARRGIDRHIIGSVMTLGPTKWQLLWHVLLPAALPQVVTAIRVSIGTAMSVLFFAETFGTDLGLGFFVTDAWMRMDYLAMFSGIVMQSITGLLLFKGVSWLECKVCYWQFQD